ncbi:MAG: hypothetical protein HY319_32255 [Armatimonadetes bacterium]|nr:hypothetical protein [Armatimonadota bacterium]
MNHRDELQCFHRALNEAAAPPASLRVTVAGASALPRNGAEDDPLELLGAFFREIADGRQSRAQAEAGFAALGRRLLRELLITAAVAEDADALEAYTAHTATIFDAYERARTYLSHADEGVLEEAYASVEAALAIRAALDP